MNKIVLYAHGGSKNHGCEAIVRGSIKNLKMNRNDITLSSRSPIDDYEYKMEDLCNIHPEMHLIKKPSLTYYYTRVWSKFFHYHVPYFKVYYRNFLLSCKGGKVALSIGGDNYCYGIDFTKHLAFMNRSAKKLGLKTVLWGCSIEPDLLNNEDIRTDLNSYDMIIARESITYNALLKMGIARKTLLIPDSAFLLDSVDLPLPAGFTEGKTIGLNLSPLIQNREKGENITYKNYQTVINYIIHNTDCQVALIPHVVLEHRDDNDLVPLRSLYEEFNHTGRVILIGDHNCMELKGFISRCRMFIGARTHSTIAAYSTCVPTLVVGYSVKAKGIARDIFGSEENMVIAVQSLKKEDDLTNAFRYIQKNEDSIKAHLQNFMPAYIEKTWQAGEQIRKLL